jgi:hypothetical protein
MKSWSFIEMARAYHAARLVGASIESFQFYAWLQWVKP